MTLQKIKAHTQNVEGRAGMITTQGILSLEAELTKAPGTPFPFKFSADSNCHHETGTCINHGACNINDGCMYKPSE